jgi:site-specific recombinase XerD
MPLSEKTFRRLAQYREVERLGPNQRLFVGRRRTSLKDRAPRALTRSGVDQLLRTLGENAALGSRINARALHESYVARMVRAGINPLVLQRVLGLSSLDTIAEFFADVKVEVRYAELALALALEI